MTEKQALEEAIKRSKIHPDITYYVFYNNSIPKFDYRNRFQVSEWINRPNDNPWHNVKDGVVMPGDITL